jgi:hypothetical protein
MVGNSKTWLLTRIGTQTVVRVDIVGPVGVAEIEHLKKNLDVALGWLRTELVEALVAWGVAVGQRQGVDRSDK